MPRGGTADRLQMAVGPRAGAAGAAGAERAHRPEQGPGVPGPGMPVPLALDLLAAVLMSGAAPRGALDEIAAALGEPSLATGLRQAAEGTLALCEQSGLPAAQLLRAAAVRERARQRMAARVAIRRVEVLLVIPAGLCLLPAFILLGVAPVVIALFSR